MKLKVIDEKDVDKAQQYLRKLCCMREYSSCCLLYIEDKCKKVIEEMLEQSRSADVLKKVYKILVKSQGKDVPLVGILFEKIWNEVKFINREEME